MNAYSQADHISARIVSFVLKLAKVLDGAAAAAGLARHAYIATVQNQPVMHVDLELCGYYLDQLVLDLTYGFARCDFRAVRDSIDVGIHRNSRMTKGRI